MTASAPGKADRIGKRRRWLRTGCWGLFILWFAWFTHVRMTTPPAALSDAGSTDGAGRDALAVELAQIIATLPPPPQTPPTSSASAARPRGWWASPVLAQGLTGSWAPGDNAIQRVASQYVTGSAGSVLDEIVRLIEEERYHGETLLPPDAQGSRWGPRTWRDDEAFAVAALTFRARYHAAQQADAGAAFRDLRAALLLAERRVSPDLTGLAQHELGCLLLEIAVPPAEATRMIAFLREEMMLSVTAGVERALRTGQDIDRFLDRFYTRDEDGDGWLVLSAAAELQSPLLFGHTTARSRVWNLFSPLFRGRATMRDKLARLSDERRVLDTLSYDEARRYRSEREQSVRTLDVLDGPLTGVTGGIQQHEFQVVFGRVMRARAAAVMLALSAYRHEHGDYPAKLEQLVPQFLDEVPLDVLTQAPFVYERSTESTYDLRPARGAPGELWSGWWLPNPPYRPNSYQPIRGAPEEP